MKKRKKKRKGFTLIELLAVILILGIIALIAIPTVNSVIEQSRRGALERSIDNYVKAVEEQILVNSMDDDTANDIVEGKYTIQELKTLGVTLKGDYPESGYVRVMDDEVFYLYANLKNSTIFRDNEGKYTIEKKIENIASDTDCYNIKIDAYDVNEHIVNIPITAKIVSGKKYRLKGHIKVVVRDRNMSGTVRDFFYQSKVRWSYASFGRKKGIPDVYEEDFDKVYEANISNENLPLISASAGYQNITISITNFTAEEVK